MEVKIQKSNILNQGVISQFSDLLFLKFFETKVKKTHKNQSIAGGHSTLTQDSVHLCKMVMEILDKIVRCMQSRGN